MNSKIEWISPYQIVYMRKVGAYGPDNYKLMEHFKAWTQSNHLLHDDSIVLGIALDNPALTKPEFCRYDVCLVVSKTDEMNYTDVNMGQITGGKYVIFKISHTADAVQKAWSEIFSELIKNHYTIDESRPIIERYQSQLIKEHFCEICVPIY